MLGNLPLNTSSSSRHETEEMGVVGHHAIAWKSRKTPPMWIET